MKTKGTSWIRVLLVLCFLIMGLGSSAQANDVPPAPPLDMPVVDLTGTLNDEHLFHIAKAADNRNEPKRPQIGVLIVESIPEGKTAAQAALEAARAWDIGSSGDKNGVLFYLAIKDREVRIETADNAAVLLTDSIAGRMLEENAVPYFKDDKFFEGTYTSVKEIRRVFETEGVANGTSAGVWTAFIIFCLLFGGVLPFFLVMAYFGTIFYRKFSGLPLPKWVIAMGTDVPGVNGSSSSGGSSFGGGGGIQWWRIRE